jgi:hypothetical protein
VRNTAHATWSRAAVCLSPRSSWHGQYGRRLEEPEYRAAAASAGACYAQVVVCEDLSVNDMLAAGLPLALSTWDVGQGRVNGRKMPDGFERIVTEAIRLYPLSL